ncbi:MAG: DUF294 nucleotidyltransferase-like domain-containing protein, partial [Pseudomonadota bacterium]|nr:DUF294 nucleotidyltransferase-like domain-containing protein [Pseudomonadota bacterium]
ELDEAGIPLCKGGVMARNEAWRADVSGWQQRIDGWIRRSRPADLLNVDIFFDLRSVHGDASLAEGIRAYAYEQGHANPPFAKLLAEASAGFSPPIGLFRRIRTEDGRVDLKRGGLLPIVSAARVLAIRHDVRERSTPARLRGLMALGIGAEHDLEALVGIHQRLLRFVLRQQIDDLEAGLPLSNAVRLKALPAAEQDELRGALSGLAHLDSLVRDLLF